jgi:6,7-dimethyl-8-ribityllumazine synthase
MADVKKSKLLNSTGIPDIQDACVVLVRTEWNAPIVDELEKGCIRKLKEYSIEKIISVNVPGAVEIPFAVKHYWENCAKKKRPDAFISLGCVMRGDTPHFEYVCRAVTDGILQLNLTLPVPVIFGVLTVDDENQANERIGGLNGHKGEEAALTAIKMISFSRSFKK